MILKDKLAWHQQVQKGLMEYLINPDDLRTDRLPFKKQLRLTNEISRIEKEIVRLKALPEWALNHGTEEGEVLQISSGMNKNRQGVELRKMRRTPKVITTWNRFL